MVQNLTVAAPPKPQPPPPHPDDPGWRPYEPKTQPAELAGVPRVVLHTTAPTVETPRQMMAGLLALARRCGWVRSRVPGPWQARWLWRHRHHQQTVQVTVTCDEVTVEHRDGGRMLLLAAPGHMGQLVDLLVAVGLVPPAWSSPFRAGVAHQRRAVGAVR